MALVFRRRLEMPRPIIYLTTAVFVSQHADSLSLPLWPKDIDACAMSNKLDYRSIIL